MIKNDITYEYRVFTNRLIDVEPMEVGRCTSKSIKELKAKDKVDGRFFHTSDSDEWFFCWGGKLQKLNLKGDLDINAALAEVEKLIADANSAVDDAKKTASEAKEADSDLCPVALRILEVLRPRRTLFVAKVLRAKVIRRVYVACLVFNYVLARNPIGL